MYNKYPEHHSSDPKHINKGFNILCKEKKLANQHKSLYRKILIWCYLYQSVCELILLIPLQVRQVKQKIYFNI